MMGGLERIPAVIIQIALSLLVWRTVIGKGPQYYLLAILCHAAVDFPATLFQRHALPITTFQLEAGVLGRGRCLPRPDAVADAAARGAVTSFSAVSQSRSRNRGGSNKGGQGMLRTSFAALALLGSGAAIAAPAAGAKVPTYAHIYVIIEENTHLRSGRRTEIRAELQQVRQAIWPCDQFLCRAPSERTQLHRDPWRRHVRCCGRRRLLVQARAGLVQELRQLDRSLGRRQQAESRLCRSHDHGAQPHRSAE